MTDSSFHPVASLFPMLADDELAELAADIKARGLLQPIVRDRQGLILDGRNRLAACKLAGVKPEYATYEGDDAAGYALAVNIQRRNLTKGQVAMVAAKARLVSRQTIRETGKTVGIDRTRIGYASLVLQFAPDLADSVVTGLMPLDEAYRTAQERKREAESDSAKLASLRKAYPELADRVTEGELTLNGAVRALAYWLVNATGQPILPAGAENWANVFPDSDHSRRKRIPVSAFSLAVIFGLALVMMAVCLSETMNSSPRPIVIISLALSVSSAIPIPLLVRCRVANYCGYGHDCECYPEIKHHWRLLRARRSNSSSRDSSDGHHR